MAKQRPGTRKGRNTVRVFEKKASRALSGNQATVVMGVSLPRPMGMSAVIKLRGLPRAGDYYRESTAVDRTLMVIWPPAAKQIDARQWEITYTYAPRSEHPVKRPDPPTDPLEAPPVIRFRSERVEEFVLVDKDDNPIINSADEPYAAQNYPRRIGHLTITRNEPTFVIAEIEPYYDTLNDKVWWGFAKGTVKFEDATAEDVRENGLTYCRVTYDFLIDRRRGWKLRLLDCGPYAWQMPEGEGAAIRVWPKDDEKQRYEGMFLLDGAGFKLSDEKIAAGEFEWNEFAMHHEKDWSDLLLSPEDIEAAKGKPKKKKK